MSRVIHESNDIVYTFDGPFAHRIWIVRPGGSMEEVKPAGLRALAPGEFPAAEEWVPRHE